MKISLMLVNAYMMSLNFNINAPCKRGAIGGVKVDIDNMLSDECEICGELNIHCICEDKDLRSIFYVDDNEDELETT